LSFFLITWLKNHCSTFRLLPFYIIV
jgi:hypothetical protein